MLNFQPTLKVINTVLSFEKCQWTGIIFIMNMMKAMPVHFLKEKRIIDC